MKKLEKGCIVISLCKREYDYGSNLLITIAIKLKTHRRCPPVYPHKPSDYRHTDKYSRVVMIIWCSKLEGIRLPFAAFQTEALILAAMLHACDLVTTFDIDLDL